MPNRPAKPVALTIGRLAKAAGVSAHSLRFWETEGLLSPGPRGDNGYRLYRADAVERVRFIVRAKALGFTLPEIRELLALNDGGGERAEVRRIAQRRIEELDRRMAELGSMRAQLATLATRCTGEGRIDGCPVVAALASARPPSQDQDDCDEH